MSDTNSDNDKLLRLMHHPNIFVSLVKHHTACPMKTWPIGISVQEYAQLYGDKEAVELLRELIDGFERESDE